MQPWLQSIYTIRFNDCDPFWHLNNSSYVNYFLNAREDHLREYYQFDLNSEYKKGNGWVIASHQISYLRPASYNEKVCIRSGILAYSSELLHVEMLMLDVSENQLKSMMHTRFVPVSISTGKKQPHSDEFMDFLSGKEVPEIDGHSVTLEKRIQYWQQQLKEKVSLNQL
jgi:acyl-CoA thioester hydrolase